MTKSKLTLLILSPFILAACSHLPQEQSTPKNSATNSLPAPDSPETQEMTIEEASPTPPDESASMDNVKEINLIAKQWEWSPSTITVNQGDTVRLIVTSTDVDHGIIIPGYKIDETIPVGETITVEFIADKAGQFPFSCSVPCGTGHGQMTGTLIVK